ncbi:MAG: protein kinase [Myxococcales bacterium]|nr:protein kinase [Myxococcales bacterium]
MVVDLGKTVVEGGSRAAPEPAGERPRLLPQIGRYTILGTLGRGGMGLVYKGYDAELDRRVAIKIFHRTGGEEADSRSHETHARAIREAQALAKLSHPNIVAVHEVGSYEGQVYIVMEYVRGETLREWLAGRPPLKRVLEVFVQIGQALAAAHRAGIVHRDLKPENVVVCSDGQAQVLDFGLARSTEPNELADLDVTGPTANAHANAHSTGRHEGLHSITLTSPGGLIGTPAYMAPEQLLRERACEHSDQYSFCVCLYEALYGVRPFVATTVDDLRLAVLAGEIPTVAVPNYTTPSYLRAAILRGLAFSREERFADMDALVAVLVNGKRRRRQRGLLLAGAVTAALAGLSAGATWVLESRAEAACAAEAGRVATLWSDATRAEVRDRMLASGRSFAAASFDRLDRDIGRFVAEWGAASEQVCAHQGASAAWDVATTARARECLEEAEWALAGLVSVLAAASPTVVTRANHATGELPQIDRCVRAELLRERTPRTGHASQGGSAALLAGLSRARSLLATGLYDDVLTLTEPLLQTARTSGEGRVVAELLLVQGLALYPRGELTLAEAVLHEAVIAAAEAGDQGFMVDALAAVAHVDGALAGRPEEGLRWGELALALARQLGASGQLRQARALRSLASVHRARGAMTPATQRLREALAVMEAEFGPEHPEVVDVRAELAELAAAGA